MFTQVLDKTRPNLNQTLAFRHVLMRTRRMPVRLLAEDQQLVGPAGQRQSQPKKNWKKFISARESLDCEIHNDPCDRSVECDQ